MIASVLFACGASEARAELKVRGAEMNRFGRIALEFDKTAKVTARISNGVLVIAFPDPGPIRNERLAAEMPGYIATVRQDPDRTGIRAALTASYRVSLLEAGEKVFVDLLPEDWAGLPPGLPPDVVADLARRAQEAEARAKADAMRRQAEDAKPIRVRVANLPSLTRLVFEPPGIASIAFDAKGEEATLLFDGSFTLDRSQLAGRLAPAVREMKVEESKSGVFVRLSLGKGYEARGFREDEAFVVDIAGMSPVKKEATTPPPAPAPPARTAAAVEAPGARSEAHRAGPEATPAPVPPAPFEGTVRPNAAVSSDGVRIVFPFSRRTAAAAFERAGILTLVFNTPEPLAFPGLPPEAEPFVRLRDIAREGTFAVVRLALQKKQIARLAPQDQGWVLTLGDAPAAPVQPLPVNRSADEKGEMAVGIPLADSSGVYWMDDVPGSEHVAVVTAFGPPRGILKPHRYVEFSLLPSLQGLAVAALADDVIVRPAMDMVTISRPGGLTLSPSGLVEESIRVPPKVEPVIQRDPWLQAQTGSVLQRWRELLGEAADAPPWQRSQKRIELARLLLANRLYPEAAGVLAHAVEENRTLVEQRPVMLLRAVAALGMRQWRDAKTLLAAPVLGEDPEAVLWRASLDATQERWPQALDGFRHAEPVLELYPESLQAELRLQAAKAAIESRDFVFADKELAAAGPVVSGRRYDELMFLHARLDQALGRADLALDAFKILSERSARPLAAEATLAYADLAVANEAISPADAISRLETLSVVWRGDEIEAATLGQLGRLYAKVGRWREAFLVARRANELFPDREITRVLHNETARLFEDLFLSGKGDSLSKVDSLALFFDFQEFTPVGRRGDEIVRRLADRLVSLDLLDQAGKLLQHQVDNRLYGAARATVAARLATVRLMDGKPALALEALRSTRLPELPQAVNRARLLLEARALSDLSRTDLALEMLDGEKGAEIERLRADILWSGQRWREAGEAHESMVGTRWQGDVPLEAPDRNDLLRAAIAYSLAGDVMALDRLRAKFSAKMAESSDARTFDFLTQPNVSSTRAFRDMARRVTSADTLADFLAAYRKRYPEAAAAAPPRSTGPQEPPPPEASVAAPKG
jgi:hypothetical protein